MHGPDEAGAADAVDEEAELDDDEDELAGAVDEADATDGFFESLLHPATAHTSATPAIAIAARRPPVIAMSATSDPR